MHGVGENVLYCICDLIYRNHSKSHIGSYEIIDFKDFNTL